MAKKQNPLSEIQKLSVKKQIKNIFGFLYNYRSKLYIVLVSSILFELLSIGALTGVFFFIQYISQQIQLKQNISDSLVDLKVISIFAIILAIVYFATFIIRFINVQLMTRVGQRVGREIRKDLFYKIQAIKLSYLDTKQSGDILSRSTNDVAAVIQALSVNITDLFLVSFGIIFSLIGMFVFSPYITLIILVFIPIIGSSLFLLARKLQPLFSKSATLIGELNALSEETISGQVVISTFNKKALIMKKFDEKIDTLLPVTIKKNTLLRINGPLNNFFSLIMTITSYFFIIFFASTNVEFGGIFPVKIDGQVQIAQVIALFSVYQLFLSNFSGPLFHLIELIHIFQASLSGTKRIKEVLEEDEENSKDENEKLQNLQGSVEFQNVNFSYDSQTNILKNISFEAKPGMTVAIVGPTGSGKTTIANLLIKFYDIKKGSILFDGKSIKKISKKSIRENVSIVLQDPFLFKGTVMENIRFGRLNATDQEVIKAAKLAHANHFITTLEKGYKTILSNNAEEISIGQKQLIAIARAILRNVNILILDEATSNVDTKTENDIQNAMLSLMKNKTAFVIAHRLSTIKNADLILVIKDGKMIEKGNHDQLLSEQGLYAQMYKFSGNTVSDYLE